MISYKYQGAGRGRRKAGVGLSRTLDGRTVPGGSSRSGLTPLKVTKVRGAGPMFSFQKVKTVDIVALTRELSVLVGGADSTGPRLGVDRRGRCKPALNAMLLDIAGG